LTRVVIPGRVRTIGDWAFSGCSRVREVVMESGVRTIGRCAFGSCWDLAQLVIPSSVTSIHDFAFHDCRGLRQMVIPSSIATIGISPFAAVTGLGHLTLVGSPLAPSVVAALEGCLASTAEVIGSALAGERFGCFTITLREARLRPVRA
jgi:hypothetical protein